MLTEGEVYVFAAGRLAFFHDTNYNNVKYKIALLEGDL